MEKRIGWKVAREVIPKGGFYRVDALPYKGNGSYEVVIDSGGYIETVVHIEINGKYISVMTDASGLVRVVFKPKIGLNVLRFRMGGVIGWKEVEIYVTREAMLCGSLVKVMQEIGRVLNDWFSNLMGEGVDVGILKEMIGYDGIDGRVGYRELLESYVFMSGKIGGISQIGGMNREGGIGVPFYVRPVGNVICGVNVCGVRNLKNMDDDEVRRNVVVNMMYGGYVRRVFDESVGDYVIEYKGGGYGDLYFRVENVESYGVWVCKMKLRSNIEVVCRIAVFVDGEWRERVDDVIVDNSGWRRVVFSVEGKKVEVVRLFVGNLYITNNWLRIFNPKVFKVEWVEGTRRERMQLPAVLGGKNPMRAVGVYEGVVV